MSDGMYEYDNEARQYRRKYPREPIAAPGPDEVGRSSDIYDRQARPAAPGPLVKPQRPPGQRARMLFWLCFFIVCGLWAWVIFRESEKPEAPQQESTEAAAGRGKEEGQPERPIPLRH